MLPNSGENVKPQLFVTSAGQRGERKYPSVDFIQSMVWTSNTGNNKSIKHLSSELKVNHFVFRLHAMSGKAVRGEG